MLEWTDSSDWNYSQVVSNFLGAWGNKGSSISFDVQFDALDIHGFNESYGLTWVMSFSHLPSLNFLLK